MESVIHFFTICRGKKLLTKVYANDLIAYMIKATKGIGRMPWHQEPMKDVTNCDKPRGAVSKL